MRADLTIYHTNDMHGRPGALERLEEEERSDPHLLLDAGDAISGSNTVFRRREPVLERMSRLGYHAMAMGNREFHYLRAVHRLRRGQRQFPLLAANLVDLRRPAAPLWQSSLERQVGGVRVGILGATPVQYRPGSVWERLSGFRFLSPEDCLAPLAEELAARNDLVILLSHLGWAADRSLARRLPGVRLVLGGHSHTLLAEPEWVGGAWILQAGSHGRFLGEIRLDLDPLRVEYRLLPSRPLPRRLLFVSNGAGEDAIAAEVARRTTLPSQALPLVGEGVAYRGAAQPLEPRRSMPSGGLVPESYGRLLGDLREGLLSLTLRQLRCLRRRRGEQAVTVAVGDLYPVALCALGGLRPLMFVGTAKSVHHHPYSRMERWVLRRFTDLCLVRDEPTADFLTRHGVPARWVGNAMMDGLEPSGADLGLAPEETCLGLLPGSRREAYRNLPRMLEAYRRLSRKIAVRALVAMAPGLDLEELGRAAPGWRLVRRPGIERGTVGELQGPAPPVLLVSGAFADVLHRSTLILGQAGTANEQAAGLGLPVVAFAPGGEGSLGWYRGRQKGLLGEALRVVEDDPETVAAELLRLLRDGPERRRRGAAGRARMGPPGGARRIARLLERLAGLASPLEPRADGAAGEPAPSRG